MSIESGPIQARDWRQGNQAGHQENQYGKDDPRSQLRDAKAIGKGLEDLA
jgi:hypothetical protein